MTNANITLDDIVNINVSLSPIVTYRKVLNSALILSDSSLIEQRINEINSLSDIAELGFSANTPEYNAAQVYFSQNPSPTKLYIGKKSSSESFIEAITSCRNENYDWYILILTDNFITKISTQDLTAICSFIESCKPTSMVAMTLNMTSDNYTSLIEELKKGNYQRTIVQVDNRPDNLSKSVVSAIVGYALGYNKKASKAFTLAYRSLSNIVASNIAVNDLKNILKSNMNIFVNQGYYYNIFRQGTMMNGDYFDEIYYIDMLTNDLQSEIMNALINNSKISGTDSGINTLTAVISEVLDNYVDIEFIQPGKWLGGDVLSLSTGDTLSQGYIILFDSIVNQSSTERKARVAPNCYICCKLAGAIEHIVIGLDVSR